MKVKKKKLAGIKVHEEREREGEWTERREMGWEEERR